MAVAHTAYQIEWSTADTISITTGSNQTSDARTIATTAVDGMVTFKADNGSTPAAGDTVDCYILYSTGDPDVDPDSADEFDTTTQGMFACTLDTNADDPAIKTVRIPTAAKSFKVYMVNNGASTVTGSAQYMEVTA